MKFITPAIYPTEVLSWLVRESGVLSLEEAHFRLSGLMAWAAGFKDRGTLREGMAADIVILARAWSERWPICRSIDSAECGQEPSWCG